MRKIVAVLLLLPFLIICAEASDFSAPGAPADVQRFMPDENESFGAGLWYILSEAMAVLQPSFIKAIRVCVCVISVFLLVGLFIDLSGSAKPVITVIGTVTIGVILFQSMEVFIQLGTQTVEQISQYGRLLLPVMAGAMAAQGAVSKSGAVYMATAFVDALLSTAVVEILIPLLYIFLCVSFVCNAFLQPLLVQIQKFLKWLMIWGLKIVLYFFTGYIGITGVVGGTTDAAMLKATKITISGMVPVVGNILSDASEAVLVSVGIMKNAAGIYGLWSIVAIWIGPFLQIGIQYLLLKLTSGIGELFALKQLSGIIKDYATAMGIVLAMTGTVCLMFLISVISFMKGVA